MKKVSVIVPVYNAEKTLPACLGNLVHQTLEDIELILVNDASTDDSAKILNDCKNKFPQKVIFIDLPVNSGPGGARNAGLNAAAGEYIGFVDSDDLADVTMYEKLYNVAIDGNYDMVDGAYYDEGTDTCILMTGDNCTGKLNNEKRSELIAGGGYLWSKLIRRSLFEHIHFREHAILEDMETLMQLFIFSESIGTTRDIVYKYCSYSGSASKLANPMKYHHSIVDAMNAIVNTLFHLPEFSGVQAAVEYSLIHLYQIGIVNAIKPEHQLSIVQQNIFLSELQKIRMQHIHIPYHQNAYIINKVSPEDLALMQIVDAASF